MRTRGFTLTELLVVMLIMSAFGLFLIQFLNRGMDIVRAGDAGRELMDRAAVAREMVTRDLESLVGPVDRGGAAAASGPASRLLADHVPLGLVAGTVGAAGGDHVPRLRGTVRLEGAVEDQLLVRALRDAADRAGIPEVEREELVERWAAGASRDGFGEVALVVWPAGDPEGNYLELRRAVQLLRPPVVEGDEVFLSYLRDGVWSRPADVLGATMPVVTGLLHLEFRFWSQHTTRSDGPPGHGGPETCWDSARAGLLSDGHPLNHFSLDRSGDSFSWTLDDVFPRSVQVTLVVDRHEQEASTAFLAEDADSEDTQLHVLRPERLPDPEVSRYLKVGGEWLRYGELRGERLLGVQRGQRGTAPRALRQGARIHGGRTVTFSVPLRGREWWNDW